jgi:Mg-chelatase subunit ChlD
MRKEQDAHKVESNDGSAREEVPEPPPRRWLTHTLLVAAGTAAVAALAFGRSPVKAGSRSQAADRPTVIQPASPPPAAPAPRPRVEMVFALDTTGSMSGLIEGAKRKIWSLASFVARGQPTPDLRVGLVAYRDKGDAYVTQRFALDDDLDRVYERLQTFSADGGGDTPEHVARALHESVFDMGWSQDSDVVKVIYLVGDAPPHEDYRDGFDLNKAARGAATKGIAVHTIRCGMDPTTEVAFRRVARLAQGEFLTIQGDGGMRDRRTPYDAEMERLHDELSSTGMGYGVEGVRRVVRTRELAEAAPAESKAERASFMAVKKKAMAGGGDLVDAWAAGTVKLDALKREELPEPLRDLDAPAQAAALAKTQVLRKDLLARIATLDKQRQAFIEEADSKDDDASGFDKVAKESLRKTASAKPGAKLKL